MTPEERGREIADRYDGGLSADAVKELAGDIAEAVREAVAGERRRCAELARTYELVMPPDSSPVDRLEAMMFRITRQQIAEAILRDDPAGSRPAR